MEYGEKIRVAKSKGKKLKLDIDLGGLQMEFDKSNLKLILKDQQGLVFTHGDDTGSFTMDVSEFKS